VGDRILMSAVVYINLVEHPARMTFDGRYAAESPTVGPARPNAGEPMVAAEEFGRLHRRTLRGSVRVRTL
jgi:hypothetical protein